MSLSQIGHYTIDIFGQASKISAFIRLYDPAGEQIGSLTFWRMAFIDNAPKLAGTLIFPETQLGDVVDVLRNEKPLYFDPESGGGLLCTTLEPVGEGED